MKRDPRETERALIEIAKEQEGYFTAAQALSVGYTYRQQNHHKNRGNWMYIDHGVYRLRTYPVVYGPEARAVLDELLEKYAEHGTAQFAIPDVLKVPPISDRGNVMEIASLFGGPDQLKEAVGELQTLLYAA